MQQLIQDAFIGLQSGGAFALMALGVVLIYRGSGVLNFSQGAMGMFGTYVFWELNVNHGVPLLPSIVCGVAAGTVISLLTYVLVIRRLRNSSELVKVAATVGLTIALESAATLRYGIIVQIVAPMSTRPPYRVFGATLPVDTVIVVVAALVLAIVTSLVFNRTRLGVTAIALRDAPMSAAAVGVSPHPVGAVTWSLGGAVAALAGILLVPLTGLSPTILTLLVIPAMAAGLLVRFEKIIWTVVLGLLIGVLESELQLYAKVSVEVIPAIPFIVIIVALVVRGTSLPARGALTAPRLPSAGNGRMPLRAVAVVVVATGVLTLVVGGNFASAVLNTCLVAILGLSVTVVTGYAGQLSLAPFALAGVGSLIAARLAADAGMSFPLAVVIAALATMIVGAVMGAPAVRIRGVNLAIASLGLALLVEQSILVSPSLTNGVLGLQVPIPTLFGLDLDPGTHPERYALVALVVLVICCLSVANLRRGPSGRRYLAVRANERGAASLGVSVPGAKLKAFAVSSFFAGLAGALMTFQYTTVTFSSYTTLASISLLVFALVAGVGYIPGAVFVGATASAALVQWILQEELGLSAIANWLTLISGLVVMDMMTRNPNGIIPMNIALWRAAKAALMKKVPLMNRHQPAADGQPGHAAASPRPVAQPADSPARLQAAALSDELRTKLSVGDTVLRVNDISVRYGGVIAVSHVDLELKAGRTLGVIGPNGAGKTSLIDAITGYAKCTGTTTLGTRQLRGRRPSRRARAGLGRTFQNLELFEDLTVRENLLVAVDSERPWSFLADMIVPGRRSLPPNARAVVEILGISAYLDNEVATLPQGVRRLVGIGRALAQLPRALCLDEPAAGLSSAERSELIEVFKVIARDLNVGVLLIEHDVDMVAATCDEVMVLNFGKIIARGVPAQVLQDSAVRAAYLGTGGLSQDDLARESTADPPGSASSLPESASPVRSGASAPGESRASLDASE
jgi:sulfate-transporting ATPase